MNIQGFKDLLQEMTLAAETADGKRFSRCFTEDAIYYDYIYGPHKGRVDIAHMLENLFPHCRKIFEESGAHELPELSERRPLGVAVAGKACGKALELLGIELRTLPAEDALE